PIRADSGHGDRSRLSCSAGDTQLGAGFCPDLQQALCTDVGHQSASPKRHELAELFRSEDDPPEAKPATRLQFALEFPRKDGESPDKAPSTGHPAGAWWRAARARPLWGRADQSALETP